MKTRNEIVEMLMAAFSKSRLSGRFDIRVVVEEFADKLEQINDEHCRQIALAKARLDAEVDALKREMASVKLDFEDFKTHKVPRRLSLGLQGGLSESSDVIDQFMSQLAETHAEYAARVRLVQAVSLERNVRMVPRHPYVERVMQKEIRQERANDPALRYASFPRD
jgi:hypothetical protein